jgi:hypothetical protein
MMIWDRAQKHTAQYLRALYRARVSLSRHAQNTHDAIGNYLDILYASSKAENHTVEHNIYRAES